MPKVKAIGTPINTQTATRTTKNRTRLPCPIAISSGCASHKTSAVAPTSAKGNKKPRQVVVSITLAWHQLVAAHVVDVGDEAPR